MRELIILEELTRASSSQNYFVNSYRFLSLRELQSHTRLVNISDAYEVHLASFNGFIIFAIFRKMIALFMHAPVG